MMRAGTKGRRQALIFMITNSGHDKTSVCYDYHEYGRKVAEGSIEDDSFFSFICSLDEGEDPFKDESCWKKANPFLVILLPIATCVSRLLRLGGCRRRKALFGG